MMLLPRVGFGFDVHQFTTGRPLILGGVQIPHSHGLAGHSDADVLLHAITDALLGAAALGDIGTHFPDTEDTWKNIDSKILLQHTLKLLTQEGYSILNIDATVAAQRPRLRPHIEAMRASIAQTLALDIKQVSIKATTTEKLGFVGREEGIAAYAVCMILPKSST